MTYPRLLTLGALTWFVAAGCGGAAGSNNRDFTPTSVDNRLDASSTTPTPLPPQPDAAVLAANGDKCTSRAQCDSGNCVDGVCCNTTCTGLCQICNLPGMVGTCSPVPEGEDPKDKCPDDGASTCRRDGMCDGKGACRKYAADTECAPATCKDTTSLSNRVCDGNGTCKAATGKPCTAGCVAGICPAPCGPTSPCQAGLFCDPTTSVCKPRKAQGQPCTTADECTSTFCVDNVCCGSACMGTCQVCNLPSAPGLCSPAPIGTDPHNQCLPEPNAPCGRAGGCDGMGACKVQPLGAPCGNGVTCSGTTESQRSCDGHGMCVATNPRSCAPYRCAGTTCGVSCISNADCAPGTACNAGACQNGGSVSGNELLHWQFDETSNNTLIAIDVSGGGHDGTYTGNNGSRPTPSTNAPIIGVPNPRSRAFDNAQRQAVRLAAFPQVLRPLNDLTVAAWYRATAVDNNGSELVSGGDSYYLRVRNGSVEFGKRTNNGGGGGSFTATCRANVNNPLNGQWHHVAGVNTTNGMVLYFDGLEVCSNNQGGDIIYDRGDDLWVGRHGYNETTWDFQGNIDDVRLFGRELTADEVRTLAGSTAGAADLILNWKLDETSTTTNRAIDSAGGQYDGTYLGNNGMLPAPSNDVAPIGVVNPRSRAFTRAQRQAIRRQNMETALKPRNDLTISLWYKASSVDAAGADLVSGGNNYVLRLRPNTVEFSKRIDNGGIRSWVQCESPAPNHLNNAWHHLAAVTTINGMVVYFDGKEICNNGEGSDMVYDQGNDLCVGRHGNNSQDWDFQGLIDDVRLYGRGLSSNEVGDLFGGTQPAELVLNWKFDETSTTTTTAIDSSSSALNGLYTGTVGFPAPSTAVPANLAGSDPRSRSFTRANRHAVTTNNMPTTLQLPNNFTVSAWYRSPSISNQGEEILSAGDYYLLRVRAGAIEFAKHIPGGFVSLQAPFANTTDNQWHHVAATATATGMRVFVDGVQIGSNARGEDVAYDLGARNFVVGRHGNNQITWDFEGNIDDVRVYSRALDDTEINALYLGH